MKYNIIGDIHGRTSWRDLVIKDGVNIFVGDYFSPYHLAISKKMLNEYINDIKISNLLTEEQEKRIKEAQSKYDESQKTGITYAQQRKNFLDIINFKQEHPETILLVGNHDEDHWHWLETQGPCSRHDYEHEKDICNLFKTFQHLFQAAYNINDKYLVTHAGLSMKWYITHKYAFFDLYIHSHIPITWNLNFPQNNQYKDVNEAFNEHLNTLSKQGWQSRIGKLKKRNNWDLILWKNRWYYWLNDKWNLFEPNIQEMTDFINQSWKDHPDWFAFRTNASYNDCYGTSESHSPMWIRYEGLQDNNPLSGTSLEQIYGHTLSDDIINYYDRDPNDRSKEVTTGKMTMVDCLEYKSKSYIIED